MLVLETSAALSGRDDRIRSFEGGADNYLARPGDADEMLVNLKVLPRPQCTQADLAKSATIANPKRAPG
ncbi:hypothetical protein [Duganella sp. HH101]|uniref:hypothetical protein n=1 Tax=Duganella sp. HH101 TaxID=1781066 RepID=UPI00114D193F|nr:hypothetical protein [Duganella sp. HH101]